MPSNLAQALALIVSKGNVEFEASQSQKKKLVNKELSIAFMKSRMPKPRKKYLNEVSGGFGFYFYVSPWPSSEKQDFSSSFGQP